MSFWSSSQYMATVATTGAIAAGLLLTLPLMKRVFATWNPRVNTISDIRTPEPSANNPSSSVYVSSHPLPVGVTIRRATFADSDGLFALMRLVACERGGLAREVDEVDREYTNGMIAAVTDGLILVAEYTTPGDAVDASSETSNVTTLVGVLKASRLGPHRCFRGVLGDTTIAIHPTFQNHKLGQALFTRFFATLANNADPALNLRRTPNEFSHILRVELIGRESNRHALRMYEKVGFRIQAKLHSRIISGMPLEALDSSDSMSLQFESDIVMVWFNPGFDLAALKHNLNETNRASSTVYSTPKNLHKHLHLRFQ